MMRHSQSLFSAHVSRSVTMAPHDEDAYPSARVGDEHGNDSDGEFSYALEYDNWRTAENAGQAILDRSRSYQTLSDASIGIGESSNGLKLTTAFSAGLRSLVNGFGQWNVGLQAEQQDSIAIEPDADLSCSPPRSRDRLNWQQQSDRLLSPTSLKPPFVFKLGNEHILRKMREEEAKQRQMEDAFLLSLVSELGDQRDELDGQVEPCTAPGIPAWPEPQDDQKLSSQTHHEPFFITQPSEMVASPAIGRRQVTAGGMPSSNGGQLQTADSQTLAVQGGPPVTSASMAPTASCVHEASCTTTRESQVGPPSSAIARSSSPSMNPVPLMRGEGGGSQDSKEQATRMLDSLTSSSDGDVSASRETAAGGKGPKDQLLAKLEEVHTRNSGARGGGGGKRPGGASVVSSMPDINGLPFSRHMNEQLMESLMLVVGGARVAKAPRPHGSGT